MVKHGSSGTDGFMKSSRLVDVPQNESHTSYDLGNGESIWGKQAVVLQAHNSKFDDACISTPQRAV